MGFNRINSQKVFFELLRAGLWEKDVSLLPYGEVDYFTLQEIAKEQSVEGLIAAGLGHVKDTKLVKKNVVPFIGKTVHLEKRNEAMNAFIVELVEKMRSAGLFFLLIKGQGVAQCYERPLWRSSGDVDLLLDADNYEKAKAFLSPLASKKDAEGMYSKHFGMTINSWTVELHGSLRCGLSTRVDNQLDRIHRDVLIGDDVRVWQNGGIDVYLPSAANDVIIVFTHFLKHFYKGGIGLRQICDWCRLLWTFKSSFDVDLLKQRLKRAGLISEWKAFGAFAVEYLGMPVDAMPLLDGGVLEKDMRLRRKAERIKDFVMMSGNFGQNRDMSYYHKYPYLIRKAISFCMRLGDLGRHAMIFPMDSLRFMPRIVFNGVRSALRRE